MSIAKIDVAIAVLKSETEMPSGSAPRIAVVQDAVLTKRQTERILCNCSQCNGTKLTPARFESHTGSRRKNWKLIVKVKGTDIKLDNLLNGKKPGVAKTTQRNAPITMKQKVEELLQEQYMPVHARWTTEMRAICRWIEDWDYNKIIICNRCQVAVHQECYGARDVNDLTSWVCRACEEPQEKKNCCLCPIKEKCDYVSKSMVRAQNVASLHTYVSHGKQISRFDSYCPDHGDVNKSNALVLCTEEIVFSSMRSQRNNARLSCSRLVRRDTENQSTSCPETDLPLTSSEEACVLEY
ncbi:histone-lysine N-methyltransferase ATX5-like protein [Carex littledalei]|uniref:Histone-lysine N-methyltransferase ATX5-like protein n=1 Tax=Carex littledalei TaxID=544730 RepID=A0A833VPW8_9POAL|nr:histone-lysine N-methyltransferase ATX5-like protein [Carex littledalei]